MYLNCKTYYSFKYGTFSTEELVKTAVEQGVTSLALTNINCTYDHWDFVKLCREVGIKPVLGAEIRNGHRLLYILLARNNEGLSWIHAFLSAHLLNKTEFPAEVMAPPCVYVILPFGAKDPETLLTNERIGVRMEDVSRLFNIDLAKHGHHFVICHPVTIQDKAHYNLHILLRAIADNVVYTKLDKTSLCSPTETFVSPHTLIEAFRFQPQLITNTYQLLNDCNIEMDFETDKNKQVFGGSFADDFVLLEKLSTSGLYRRYGKKNKEALKRMHYELGVIRDMGFTSYFHINYDFIRFADSEGFYHVGRGSGANSIVAYCLGITDVDPMELNLYFERFLNPERTSPPDFDIDFSWTDRDRVMEYMFDRHGRQHVCLLGTCTTFKSDAAVRKLGQVFGLPADDIKTLQRTWVATDRITKRILAFAEMMYGFPDNPSVHACGVLISEKPLSSYLTLFMPPKGLPTAQMNMFTAEDIGLNKFDVLSQRGLGHIKDTLRLVKEQHGFDIDIHAFHSFKNDPKIRDRIKRADTIGCFYIESPAMRGLLAKLECDDYPTLVAASSIIRPGVAQSGMMRAYIERYHDPSLVEYIHPLFKEHLGETFGVMVFQEDVIKIAHYYGGLSLGKADILRRAMSGKYRSHNKFNEIKAEFFASAIALGREPIEVAEVWRQMESFAGYSFNKAHSASFAVESYMSLYLKTYYPQEFMVAVINNFGGFYSRELYFLELLKCGGHIELPCVNNSDHYTNIVGGKVFVGFIHIKGLQDKFIECLLENRKSFGEYKHLQDFIERTGTELEQLNTLISIGAFRFTGKTKKALLWEANFLQKKAATQDHHSIALFEEAPYEIHLPSFEDHPNDDLYDQMELLGFTTGNPFALADADPSQFVPAKDIGLNAKKTITMLAYFIARKHVTTVNNDQMFFGTFVDSELNWIDTVHFPDAAKKYPLHSSGFYKIKGRVAEDFGVFSLEVHHMETVGFKHRSYQGL